MFTLAKPQLFSPSGLLLPAQTGVTGLMEQAGAFAAESGLGELAAEAGYRSAETAFLFANVASSMAASGSPEFPLAMMAGSFSTKKLRGLASSLWHRFDVSGRYRNTVFQEDPPAEPFAALKRLVADQGLKGGVSLQILQGDLYLKSVAALLEHIDHLIEKKRVKYSEKEVLQFIFENGFHPDGKLRESSSNATHTPYVLAFGKDEFKYVELNEIIARDGKVFFGDKASILLPNTKAGFLFSVDGGRYFITSMEGSGTIRVVHKKGEESADFGVRTYLRPGLSVLKTGRAEVHIWVPGNESDEFFRRKSDIAVAGRPNNGQTITDVLQPIPGAPPLACAGWREGKILIGRVSDPKDRSAELGFAGLVDPMVSRNHAALVRQGEALYIEDQGSSNGTFVNERRITAHMMVPVHEGDVLRIGSPLTAYRVRGPERPVLQAERPVGEFVYNVGRFQTAIDMERVPVDKAVALFSRTSGVNADETVEVASLGLIGMHAYISKDGKGNLYIQPAYKAGDQNHLIKISGSGIACGVWTPLKPGNVIDYFYDRSKMTLYYDGVTDYWKTLEAAEVADIQQIDDALEHGRSFESAIKLMSQRSSETIKKFASRLEKVAIGAEMFQVMVPNIFGWREKIEALMRKEIDEIRKEVPWALKIEDQEADVWSALQREYISAKYSGRAYLEVLDARRVEDFAVAVTSRRFKTDWDRERTRLAGTAKSVARRNGSGVQDVPSAFGMRQRARDILEAKDHHWFEQNVARVRVFQYPPDGDAGVLAEYQKVRQARDDLYAYIRKGGVVDAGGERYTPDELTDIAYMIMERGYSTTLMTREHDLRERVIDFMKKTIAVASQLFPNDMNRMRLDTNRFTGESISIGELETVYRFARHLMNSNAGVPIFGYRTEKEMEVLRGVLQKCFPDDTIKDTYEAAQDRLRRAIEGLESGFFMFLATATEVEKYVVLRTYFGNYRHRQIKNISLAYKIYRLLGEAGFDSEIGKTVDFEDFGFTANLTLGTTEHVSPESHEVFFTGHSHPRRYLDSEGQVVDRHDHLPEGHQRTVYLLMGQQHAISGWTGSVMFSRGDLEHFPKKAEWYFEREQKMRRGKTPWYDPETRTFKTWLTFSWGIARMDLSMSESGRVTNITVSYAAKTREEAGFDVDAQYKIHAEKLKAHGSNLGYRMTMRPLSYGDLSQQYPAD